MSSGVYALEDQRLVRVEQNPQKPKVELATRHHSPISEPGPFFRSLAFLLDSGYPMGRAFGLLADGMERPSESLVCHGLEKCLNEGRSLAQAFSDQKFPTELVSAIEAGEVAGRVEESMEWYADFEERNLGIRREIKQALLNPCITLGFSLLFAILLPPFILKDQLTILASSGAKLPLLSKALLYFAEAITHPLMLLLLPLGYAVYRSSKRYLSTVAGRRRFERLVCKIPVIGDAFQRAAGTRCLSLMSMILKSGGSPVSAMLIAGKGCGSRLLKDRLQISVHSLIGGVAFADSLVKTHWFLRSSLNLLQAGDACGDTSDMMEFAAGIEEDKLRESLGAVAAVIQPLALGLVGAIVCLMVIAVLGPSLSMISAL